MPSVFKLPFIRKEKASNNDAYSFYFDKSKNPFDFIPGQYVRVTLPDVEDERGKSRYFSLSASPTEPNLMITTRIIQSPFKKRFAELSAGEEVQFWGPTGKFILDETATKPLVLIAGGIGITPFRSMLVYAHEKGLKRPITLLASFSTVEDIVYFQNLSILNTTAIKTVTTVTHPEQSQASWDGEVGRVDAEMIKRHVSDIDDCTYMIAGPEVMVDALAGVVRELGVDEEHIVTESFSGY